MRSKTTWTIFSLFALLALPAFSLCAPGARAEGKGTPEGEQRSVRSEMVDAKGRKIQVVDFEDAVIQGAARAPEGFVLQSRQGATFRSIVELRREFRGQIELSGTALVPIVPIIP
jgi:hypothetical protein